MSLQNVCKYIFVISVQLNRHIHERTDCLKVISIFVLQDYVQALTGLCYDGVEGLIYLVLFSFVTALMFSSIVCSVPHTWQGKR